MIGRKRIEAAFVDRVDRRLPLLPLGLEREVDLHDRVLLDDADHRFSDALEVIAEHTRAALGAASFSISRWHRERGVLHTIINVGDLGPGEQRWPTDEEYPLADYRNVLDLLRQGRPYVTTLDDDDIDPANARRCCAG